MTNPAPATDWAPAERLDDARRNAPLRTRTLDRAVSVVDYADFAAAYAGVGMARADAVWDGRRNVLVVSALGTAATPPSGDLLADLGTALDLARDPTQELAVLAGELRFFAVRLALLTDPAYVRAAVEQAVLEALLARLGHAARTFAAPVTAAEVLTIVQAVGGVTACTMPRLSDRSVPSSQQGRGGRAVLVSAPARWGADGPLPAQLLGLAPDGVEIGVMA